MSDFCFLIFKDEILRVLFLREKETIMNQIFHQWHMCPAVGKGCAPDRPPLQSLLPTNPQQDYGQ